eukprot:940798-Amphidinium_carterae.1
MMMRYSSSSNMGSSVFWGGPTVVLVNYLSGNNTSQSSRTAMRHVTTNKAAHYYPWGVALYMTEWAHESAYVKARSSRNLHPVR